MAPVDADAPDQVSMRLVIGTDTRPAAQDDEKPLATEAEPHAVVGLGDGWLDQLVEELVGAVECT
jgi:hypothetical protein